MFTILEQLESRTLFAAGDLDPGFGNGDGIDFDRVNDASIHDSEVLADGKIVVAGSIRMGPVGNRERDFFLARYNANGSTDLTFGEAGTGIATLDFRENDYISCIAIQSDGKIVVAGASDAGNNQSDFALSRFNADGTRDNSFGINGRVLTDMNDWRDAIGAMVIQPEGKILVAGSGDQNGDEVWTLARYDADGDLDTSFGTGGRLWTPILNERPPRAMSLTADNKIIIAGGSDERGGDIALAKFHANGSLDTSFGNDGIVLTNFEVDTSNPELTRYSHETAHALAVLPDGKLLVSGNWLLVRYEADGDLDGSFGDGGRVVTKPPNPLYFDEQTEMKIAPDGKILLGGEASLGVGEDFMIMRLKANGTRDNSFGSRGIVVTDFATRPSSSERDLIRDLEFTAEGNILAVGYAGGLPVMAQYLGDQPSSVPAFAELKSNGVLVVRGTAGDDDIEVLGASGTFVTVRLHDNSIRVFFRNEVQAIRIYGGDGDDIIRVTSRPIPCRVMAGAGNDTFFGSGEEDHVKGQSGNDTLHGNGGNDTLLGGDGDDELYGGENNDYLHGGDGDDFLNSGTGSDHLYGRAGNDRFNVFGSFAQLFGGGGTDSAEDVNADDELTSIEELLA